MAYILVKHLPARARVDPLQLTSEEQEEMKEWKTMCVECVAMSTILKRETQTLESHPEQGSQTCRRTGYAQFAELRKATSRSSSLKYSSAVSKLALLLVLRTLVMVFP